MATKGTKNTKEGTDRIVFPCFVIVVAFVAKPFVIFVTFVAKPVVIFVAYVEAGTPKSWRIDSSAPVSSVRSRAKQKRR